MMVKEKKTFFINRRHTKTISFIYYMIRLLWELWKSLYSIYTTTLQIHTPPPRLTNTPLLLMMLFITAANPFNRTSCFQTTNPLFKSNKNIFSHIKTKFHFYTNQQQQKHGWKPRKTFFLYINSFENLYNMMVVEYLYVYRSVTILYNICIT